MAGVDLPDTLTPEQAAKLGLIPAAKTGGAATDMPDVLTPEQAKRLGLTAEAPETDAFQPPGLFERIGDKARAIGRTVSTGAGTLLRHNPIVAFAGAEPGHRLEAVGEHARQAVTDLTEPAKRREILRGFDNVATLGYGQRIAARVGNALGDVGRGESLNETRNFTVNPLAGSTGGPSTVEAADRAAAPGFQEGGTVLGLASPGAAGAAIKGGANLVRLGTSGIKATSLPAAAALGAARAVGGYEASAPILAAASADAEGNRLGAAREAATDPLSLLLAGTTGAAGGAISRTSETAPARLAKRRAKDITTGDVNAGKKLTQKVQERAGEGGEQLDEVLAQYPELDKVISIKAGSAPEKVAKAVTAKTGEIGDELHDIYANMEKAGRVVAPADIAVEFDKLLGDKLKAGDQPAVRILRQERARFLDEYGKFGHLSADTMRGLKATAGKGAFEGMPIPGNIKRDIWGVYSAAIERQAAKSKDLGRLRTLNRDMSVLIPVEQAITERAQMSEAGRHSIGSHIGRAALAGAGFAHGGVKEAVVGLVAPEIAKAAGQGLRAVDYNLARRFKGAAPDLSSGAGARVTGLDYAARVSEGMKNGLSLKEAVDAADGAE